MPVNGKLFDLHFEIGVAPPGSNGFYAKTVLGNNGVIFQAVGSTPAAAISKVVIDMESSNIWSLIHKNPAMSVYPFNGTSSTRPHAAVPVDSTTVDPKAPKKRPSDLHSVDHPLCQQMCQSFDHFGITKCKNICAQRSGL